MQDGLLIVPQPNYKKIDAIVFDLGGVLINWSPYNLYRKLFNNDKDIAKFLAKTDLYNCLQGVDENKPFEKSVTELSLLFPRYSDLISAYWLRWEETIGGSIEGSIEIVLELKTKGMRLYVISNWSSETWHHAINRFAFLDLFDGLVISGFEGMAKPDPKIFHLARNRYNLVPERTVFIDDMVSNVECAVKLGFKGIHFRSAPLLRQELTAMNVI